jgi:hypothetical protein
MNPKRRESSLYTENSEKGILIKLVTLAVHNVIESMHKKMLPKIKYSVTGCICCINFFCF